MSGIVTFARVREGEPAHSGSVNLHLVRADGKVFPCAPEELEAGVLPGRLADAFADEGGDIQVRQVWQPDCGLPQGDVVEWVLRSWTDYPPALESGDQCRECHEVLMAVGSQPAITGPPSAQELADPAAWWRVANSPSSRFRVIFRAHPGPSHWWLLDGEAVVAEGQEAIYRAAVGDAGRCLLVVPQPVRELSRSFQAAAFWSDFFVEQELRLVGANESRTLAVLPDWFPVLDLVDDRYAVTQNGWSFRAGLRPDDERLLQVWDLSGAWPSWSAQPRFVADQVRLERVRGTVTVRSERYGETVLRLTDGFLVSDRVPRLSAQPPRYPGVVEGV